MLPTSLSFWGGYSSFIWKRFCFSLCMFFFHFKRVVRIKMYCVCAQSCLTLCNPVDCSPPGSSVYGLFQARILEWVAWIFQTLGSNPRLLSLLHGRRIRYHHAACTVLYLVAQPCPILCDPLGCSPPGFSVRGDSPSKNTGVGCHALLQAIFPTQGMNPGLPHCRQILYCLSPQGRPGTLGWVAYPFSRGSSQPQNRSGVSRIAGGFFTS